MGGLVQVSGQNMGLREVVTGLLGRRGGRECQGVGSGPWMGYLGWRCHCVGRRG